jgi:hypothetical protein
MPVQAAVVVVLLVLRQQCNTVCTSVLLYQVDPTGAPVWVCQQPAPPLTLPSTATAVPGFIFQQGLHDSLQH